MHPRNHYKTVRAIQLMTPLNDEKPKKRRNYEKVGE